MTLIGSEAASLSDSNTRHSDATRLLSKKTAQGPAPARSEHSGQEVSDRAQGRAGSEGGLGRVSCINCNARRETSSIASTHRIASESEHHLEGPFIQSILLWTSGTGRSPTSTPACRHPPHARNAGPGNAVDQRKEATREPQAAFAAPGGPSSVPKTLSQKRLVTPKPFSKSAKWCCRWYFLSSL